MKASFLILALLVVAGLSGCASRLTYDGLVGQSRASLIERMGAPTREYATQGLKKLHYNEGFGSSHTYFFYLDSNDRVIQWEQVRTEERFNQIKPGMKKDEVIDLLGDPTVTNGLARDRGSVWHYRYETPFCKSFVIEFTDEDEVRSSGYRIRSGRTCKAIGVG